MSKQITMATAQFRPSFELDPHEGAAHPYDQLKTWISEHRLTHLKVTTTREGRSLTTVGEIDIVEGLRRKPAQIQHIAAHSDLRSIVIASTTAWPDQIDRPPFEHPVYINPRITAIVGIRKD